MKKIFWIAYFLICVYVGAAQAGQITLAWDANNPTPNGYRLYQHISGATYDFKKPLYDGNATECTVDVPDGAESFFVVRAYITDSQGNVIESTNSNEVSQLMAPVPPNNLIIKAINQIIQGLNTLKEVFSAAR